MHTVTAIEGHLWTHAVPGLLRTWMPRICNAYWLPNSADAEGLRAEPAFDDTYSLYTVVYSDAKMTALFSHGLFRKQGQLFHQRWEKHIVIFTSAK